MTAASRSLCLLLFVVCANALPDMYHGRPKGGFVNRKRFQKVDEKLLAARVESGEIVKGLMKQKLDHFNDADTTTWNQTYYANVANYKGSINFLYISGESAASPYDVDEGGAPGMYAADFGAGVYSLEHRFYGESRPTVDNRDEDLKFLSSRQALEDVASFIRAVNAQLTGDQKWVVFGGSYSANLALWFRELYPDLAVGAVGSSGPVMAQLDFYGYLTVVEDNFRQYDRMYKKDCAGRVSSAFDEIEQKMEDPKGREYITRLLDVYPYLEDAISDQNSITLFYLYTIIPLMTISQYDGMDFLTMFCDRLTNTTGWPDPLEGFAASLTMKTADDMFYIDYQAEVDYLKQTNWSGDPDYRSWEWQTCTEFGYYQTTDRGSNMFHSTVPSNYYINSCKDSFGISLDQLKASIDDTNDLYGAKNFYTGTNVVFIQGTFDPWHWLGIADNLDSTSLAFVIPNGTHCSDMYPSNDPGATQAQALIRTSLDSWLNGPPNPISKRNITDNSGKPPGSFHTTPLPSQIVLNEKPVIPSKPVDYSIARRIRNPYTGRFNHGLRPPPYETDKVSLAAVQGWITQPVDHFNALDRRTFQQKFYSNKQWAKSGGPNFLMIGGEGPESDTWVTNSELAWIKYAQEVGATVYLLEHRYYGDSKTGTGDLTYLTSAQMLFDVANFINQTNKNTGSFAKWVTFGGSYSGALSAWAREWFPDLIAGAVGSSGPVEAKIDFYEYLLVVQKALGDFSPKCALRTQQAFDQLRNLSTSAVGRQRISQLFRLDPPWTASTVVSEVDFQQVFTYLYGDFQGVVQYSDDNNSAGSRNVSTLCGYISSDKEPIAALADLHNWAYGSFYEISSSADADNQYLKSLISQIESGDPNELAGILWTWQTCNEFGYYQSTDYGTGLFGSVTPVNYFVEMCESVFKVSMDMLAANVDKSIYQYGGRHKYRGSNVVLPNGSHDPWSALGLYNHSDPSVVSILIQGTAHCADMYPARDSDLPGLVDARTQILANIKQWLA